MPMMQAFILASSRLLVFGNKFLQNEKENEITLKYKLNLNVVRHKEEIRTCRLQKCSLGEYKCLMSLISANVTRKAK